MVPVAVLNVPAGQVVGDTLPEGQYEPAGHKTQVELLVVPVAVLNVPAGQVVGDTLPEGQ